MSLAALVLIILQGEEMLATVTIPLTRPLTRIRLEFSVD
jgi:hypothetical protein